MIRSLPEFHVALKPRPFLHKPKPHGLPRERKLTIALHMWSGDFSYVTAADTQTTYYPSGEKVHGGKIAGAWRRDPWGAINITGAGDALYIDALSQKLIEHFDDFKGATIEQLKRNFERITRAFYAIHVLPFVGRLQDENLPDYKLLVAVTHHGIGKLWTVHKTIVEEAGIYECVGVGTAAARSLIGRFWSQYPTLDSTCILAAYVIYRVKSSVEGCGLKTEIRFIHRNTLGFVRPDLIDQWESLFKKYDDLEEEIFYHAMNFAIRPSYPPVPDHLPKFEDAFPPQMRPLPDIVKDIEAMRAEFAKLTVIPR
jgi:hypothetical protein